MIVRLNVRLRAYRPLNRKFGRGNTLRETERQQSIRGSTFRTTGPYVQHAKLIERRDRALTLYESLQRTQPQSSEVVRLRLRLSEGMTKWLGILHARTIPQLVTVDSYLKPTMGEEKLDIFKGSSKARTVLAYHAALFEICLIDPLSPFRVLILDTPKQQDIPNEHLDSYVQELRTIAAKYNGQVIFSTSSYRYTPDEETDEEWLPSFVISDEAMYLGSPDAREAPPEPV